MGDYRDETESLRARVVDLEEKLARAEAEAARLRGEIPPSTAPDAAPSRDNVVGEPLHFVSEERFPYELDDAGFEAIASMLRARRNAQVAQVGRTLTAPGFSLRSSDGVTEVRLETDARGLRAGVFAGSMMAGLFGGLPMTGLVLDLAQHASISPWHLAWAIPAVMLGGGVAMRRIAAGTARKSRAGHEGVMAAVRELASTHRARPAPRARVRLDDVEDDVALAEEEMRAGAEAKARGGGARS